jgi:acyl transferase domain-containing protein/acyl carrier protein
MTSEDISVASLRQAVRVEIARLMGASPGELDLSLSLSELGLDSVKYVSFARFLEPFDVHLTPDALYEFSSVDDLLEHLQGEAPAAPVSAVPDKARGGDSEVAIIGVALELPGAHTLDEYWARILSGEALTRTFPYERLPAACRPDEAPLRVRFGGFVDDVSGFDAAFFGISPREAKLMDPQQRLIAECVWHALENASIVPQRLSGTRTGVFVGASSFDYSELLSKSSLERTAHVGTGLSHAILANRVSQFLNLKGDSETIDTACSSSLVALHRAVETLRAGRNELCIVGGVNVIASLMPYLAFEEAGMLSPDGRCRPFDDAANGYVRGEGCVCVVLKPLRAAKEDGDRILGVIKGTAVRHGGKTSSLTVPSREAQAEVIEEALRDAGVAPESVGYVEAHGTGTRLGDPIEAAGLAKAYGGASFVLGSVKAQIGHLEAAAGLAGLVKALLVVRHGVIPPSAHLDTVNRHIDAHRSFRFAAEATPWHEGQPRRAGVSSFGFGGTNAHVVLEAAPEHGVEEAAALGPQVFVLSAKSEEALVRLRRAYVEWLASERASSEPSFLPCLARSMSNHRAALPHRLAIVASTVEALMAALEGKGPVHDAVVFACVASKETGGALGALFSEEHDLATRLKQLGRGPVLAQLWVNGLDFDWCALEDDRRGHVELPLYPFVHEPFWVDTDAEASILAPVWEAAPLAGEPTAAESGPLLVLTAGAKGRAVAEAMLRSCDVTFVEVDALKKVEQCASSSRGFVDLTTLDEDLGLATLPLVQAFVAARSREPAAVVHVTARVQVVEGDEDGASLAAGFYPVLGAEYSRCRASWIDFGDAAAEVVAGAILTEVARASSGVEIAYRSGVRYVKQLRATNAPRHAPGEAGVVFITGGTGDIGLALARHMMLGGFSRFVLTGRSALTTEKRQRIAEMEAAGASFEFYLHELGDTDRLRGFVAEIRSTWGRISHVLHCAGQADRETAAFIRKSTEGMASVFAPKALGLRSLHAVFETEPPHHFVLFSSIAAAAPRFGAGVSDYAAANRYMDLYAAHQWSRGATYFRSVQWSRWSDMGLARGGRFQDGLTPLTRPQALEAFDRVLSYRLPNVCVLSAGDEALLREPLRRPAAPEREPVVDDRASLVRGIVAAELGADLAGLSGSASLETLGIDSIILVGILVKLEKALGVTIDPAAFARCDSLDAIVAHLATLGATKEEVAAPKLEPQPARRSFPVAVIGISCRFPGSDDQHAFWQNLVRGVDSISDVPPPHWPAGVGGPTRFGGFIRDIEYVDPSLFGMQEAEAADVDPLIRLFSECTLDCVRDAGYERQAIAGKRVGVFAGARGSRYAERIPAPGKHSVTAIGQNFISAFTSHILDLRGPSMVIDCACSSSLAAIHLGCQSLESGDSDLVLAGGVEVLLDDKPHEYLDAAHALSPEGRCRTFDVRANGFVPGEGVGCVLLKPLAKALEDGDAIYAVIEGSAMNNDGHTLGVTTPGQDGQTEVVQRALAKSGVAAKDIGYVEAHGTGTLIGDPIELRSLTRAFAGDGIVPGSCPVGSVKTNIGHLLSAAGVASFVKVALSLHHGMLPASLHCQTVNPRVEFDKTPFYPLTSTIPWEGGGKLRRAGVSAFGFGKSNVHVIVGERPAGAKVPVSRPPAESGRKVRAWHGASAIESDTLLSMEDLVIEEGVDSDDAAGGETR